MKRARDETLALVELLNTKLAALWQQQLEGTVVLRAQLREVNDNAGQMETWLKAAQNHSLAVERHLRVVSHERPVASAESEGQKARIIVVQMSLLNLLNRLDDYVSGSAGICLFLNEGLTCAFEAHFIALLENIRGETRAF